MQDLELRPRETSPRAPHCLNYTAQFRDFLIAGRDELPKKRNESGGVAADVSQQSGRKSS